MIPVILKVSSILGFKRNEPIKFQPASAGNPTHWSAMGLPNGLTINPDTGLISGSVPEAIVAAVLVTAANEDGESTELFPVGIDQQRYYSSTEPLIYPEAIEIEVVLPAATVRVASGGAMARSGEKERQLQELLDTLLESWAAGSGDKEAKQADVMRVFREAWSATPAGSGGAADASEKGKPLPLFALKSDDVRQLIIRFVDTDGQTVTLIPRDLCFSSKRFEPEQKLFYHPEFDVIEPGVVEVIIEPSGTALNAELLDEERDDETAVNVLCEIEWTSPVGNRLLRTSTPNFHVRIERDLTGEK